MYFIKESDSHKLLLQRKGIGGKVFLFIFVGLFFLSIGLAFFIFNWHPGSVSGSQIGGLLIGFGSIAIFAGLNAPAQHRNTVPAMICFDNEKGFVKIQQSETGESSYIPYSDISHFYLDVRYETSSNNTSRSSRTPVYYVLFSKKDQGVWELFTSHSVKKAEAFLQRLQAGVQLDQLPASLPKPILTDKVNKDVQGDKITIRWRNKGVAGLIMLLLFGAFFSYVFWFIFSQVIKDAPGFAYVVVGLIVLIFLFIIVFQMRKMIRNITTVFGFSINRIQFEYFEEAASGMLRKSEQTPLKDLHCISFSFQPSRTSEQVTPLSVYTKADMEKKEKINESRKGLEIIKDSIALHSRLISLDLSSLNAVEKLELERWIQSTIREKSDTVVI